MAISYKPLFKKLIDENLEKKDLINNKILSRSTLVKINKGEYISLEIVDKICEYLKCNVNNVIEYVKEDDKK